MNFERMLYTNIHSGIVVLWVFITLQGNRIEVHWRVNTLHKHKYKHTKDKTYCIKFLDQSASYACTLTRVKSGVMEALRCVTTCLLSTGLFDAKQKHVTLHQHGKHIHTTRYAYEPRLGRPDNTDKNRSPHVYFTSLFGLASICNICKLKFWNSFLTLKGLQLHRITS